MPRRALECDRPHRISNGSLLSLRTIPFGTGFLPRWRTICRSPSLTAKTFRRRRSDPRGISIHGLIASIELGIHEQGEFNLFAESINVGFGK
jgi:hypothetical protein